MIQYSISVFSGPKIPIKICIRHLLVEKYGPFFLNSPQFLNRFSCMKAFKRAVSFYWIITVFLSLSALLSGTLRTFQRRTCDSDKVSLACPRGTSISIELAQYEKNGIGKSGTFFFIQHPKLKPQTYTRKPTSARGRCMGGMGSMVVV